jgi:hypothetical protein
VTAEHVCRRDSAGRSGSSDACADCAGVRADLAAKRAAGPKSPRPSKHDPKRAPDGSPRMASDIRSRHRGRACAPGGGE